MENKLLVFLCNCLLLLSCEKWDYDQISFSQVITVGAIEVGVNEAFLIGDLENLRNNAVIERGFVISSSVSDDQQLKIEMFNTFSQLAFQQDTITSDQAFAAKVSGLSRSTIYFFRAFAKLNEVEQPIYGSVDSFQTNNITISILGADCITQGLVNLTAQVSGLGLTEAAEGGFVWSHTNEFPMLGQDNKLPADVMANGSFSKEVPITENQLYYLRAYVELESSEPIYSDAVWPFSTSPGGQWIRSADFPGKGRGHGLSFSIGDKGYFGFGSSIGGCDAENETADFWEFDPMSGWNLISSGGQNLGIRTRLAGFVIDGKGYAGFGCNCDNIFNDFYEFDPSTKTWTRLANTSLGFRQSPISFSIANNGYVGNGRHFSINCNDNCNPINICVEPEVPKHFFQFDPISSSAWSTQTFWDIDQFQDPFSSPPTIFSIGSKAYVGFSIVNSANPTNDFWEFDPETGWRKIASFPGRARVEGTAFVIRDKAYVGLGEVSFFGGVALSDVYEFDPQSEDDPWKKVANFPGTGIIGATSFSVNGRGYAGLGETIDNTTRPSGRSHEKDLWEYIPELCQQ